METAAQGSSSMLWFIMLAVMVFVLFFPARSQKKREQEHKAKVDALQKGDQIVLANGIVGTVVGFKDDSLEVKVAENVKLTVLKSAVAAFLNDRVQNTPKGGKK